MNSLDNIIKYNDECVIKFTSLINNEMKNGIQSIYNDTKKNNKDRKKILKEFQINLSNIPKWSQKIIDDEYNRLKVLSKCDYFDDLIKNIFKSYFKVLFLLKKKREKLVVPSSTNVIHQCYISIARNIWKQPNLFYHKFDKKHIQNNHKLINKVIEQSIKLAIKELLPFKEILNNYLENDELESEDDYSDFEEYDIDDIKNNTNIDKEPDDFVLEQKLNKNEDNGNLEGEDQIEEQHEEEVEEEKEVNENVEEEEEQEEEEHEEEQEEEEGEEQKEEHEEIEEEKQQQEEQQQEEKEEEQEEEEQKEQVKEVNENIDENVEEEKQVEENVEEVEENVEEVNEKVEEVNENVEEVHEEEQVEEKVEDQIEKNEEVYEDDDDEDDIKPIIISDDNINTKNNNINIEKINIEKKTKNLEVNKNIRKSKNKEKDYLKKKEKIENLLGIKLSIEDVKDKNRLKKKIKENQVYN